MLCIVLTQYFLSNSITAKNIQIKTSHNQSFTADLLTKFTQINCAEKLPDAQGLSTHNKGEKNVESLSWQSNWHCAYV